MKFPIWLLIAAYIAFCCVVAKGDQQLKQQNHVPSVKNTRAPLLTSTVAPAKVNKVKKISPAALAQLVPSTAKTAAKKDLDMESLPIKSPAMVDHPLQAEESTPLAVTGLITQNGNIYEIENSNGIGKIESRQAQDEGQHICNYGAVVVYSDVPCEKVNNIKIREIEDKPNVESTPAAAAQQENSAEDNEVKPYATNFNRPNKNGQKRPNRPVQNRPNRPGQNRPNQNRPGNNQFSRPNKRPSQNAQNRPNQNGQKRPNQNGQKRPNQNAQKRPNQNAQNRPNQSGPKRPIQNNQNRPNQNGQKRPLNNVNVQNGNKSRRVQQQYNKRKWEAEEEYEDDDNEDRYNYPTNRRRNQAQFYVSDYDDDDY